LTQAGQGGSPDSQGYAVALAPDGKIVTAGPATDANGEQAVAIIRYTASGVPDPSFGPGGNGVVVTQLGAGTSPRSMPYLNGLAVLPDGRIVISSSASDASRRDQVVVARYTAAGVLDPSGGIYRQQLGLGPSPHSRGTGLAVMGDGRLIVAGAATDSSGMDEALALRLTSAGQPDLSFGSGGIQRHQYGKRMSGFNAVTVLADGSSVFGGDADDTNGDDAFLIARLTPGGQVDSSFGSGGGTISQIGQQSTANSSFGYLVRRHGSGFLVVGSAADAGGNSQFAMERFTGAGAVDVSFGSSGRVLRQLSPVGNSIAYGAVVQPNGTIVLTGGAVRVDNKAQLVAARYLPTGTPDPSFGDGGVVQRQFANIGSAESIATGAVWQPDGKIVMAGLASDAGMYRYQFLTTRLIANLPPKAAYNASTTAPHVGQPVSFDAAPSSDPDGVITRASWDFGDGAKAHGRTASHAFAQPGTYTVRLTVVDDNDVTASASQTITVTLPPAPPPPPARPALSKLKLRPTTFRAAKSGGSIARSGGSKVSYSMTAAASTTFSVQRAVAGVRRGGKCVRPATKDGTRKARRCTRYVAVKGTFTHRDTAGANAFRFSGRLKGRRLAPGSYRLVAQPSSPAGKGTKKTAAFRIIR
jgi:uncharacterized delta-60 repeat protein